MAMLFVSPFGSDDDPGTLEAPFLTIEKGIEKLKDPGDVLFLRGGCYAEDVTVIGKQGSALAPIQIRAYGRERVSIDGAEPRDVDGHASRFRVGGNHEWRLAIEEDPDAHEEEYISIRTFPVGEPDVVRHGAFLDREPYTRLITYSLLEDLRAVNQTFGRLPLNDPLPPFPGFAVLDKNNNPEKIVQPDGTEIAAFKRPWVYMGPGLFFDDDGRIHVRLSHTTNNVPGIVDYDGGTDPRQIRLALSPATPAPLVVEKCRFVHFDHLDVRFGGGQTVRIEESDDVVFDHVRVFASRFGVRLGHDNNRLALRHCEVLGGMPPWMFRSDIKDGYKIKIGDQIITNELGHGTSQTLLFGTPTVVDTIIDHCEFVDGHDLFMFGDRTRFHHNWIHNLNDDGLVVDAEGTSDLEVSESVIMRCLEAIGFAQGHVGGGRRIHHSLIDLRGPTASIRPRPCGHLIDKDDQNKDGSVFRFGQLYKSNPPDGPLDLFHNTCLVAHQTGLAGIQHYRSSIGETRRAFNNIFVDVNPSPDRPNGYANMFLPEPTFHGPTDANCYFQLAGEPNPLLRHDPYVLDGQQKADSFADLEAYRTGVGQNPAAQHEHFEDSKAVYPPGFEEHSIDQDPQFKRIAADGVPQIDDDLRLQDLSPARGSGLELSEVGIDDPLALQAGPPDLGCYPSDGTGLDVGVDGRRQFPEPSQSNGS